MNASSVLRKSRTYSYLRDFQRLEYEPISGAIQDKTFFPRLLDKAVSSKNSRRHAIDIFRFVIYAGYPDNKDSCVYEPIRLLRASEKMFYPNWLVSDLVFCVAESSEYLDMHRFPRLEFEAASSAIPGKTFFPRPLGPMAFSTFNLPRRRGLGLKDTSCFPRY